MGGGTTGLDESFLYTADIEYGWGDACDKKAMHGCPRIKKASVMDVEDVKEWVVWVKPEAFYAQPMVFEEDSKKCFMKLKLLNALFDCKDFLERGVIMLLRCFKSATLDSISAETGIFSGGIFSGRHLIAFTASVCLGVHYGGFF
ncbi:hypothetical protein Tco_0299424 [Tanacetum coccineum]